MYGKNQKDRSKRYNRDPPRKTVKADVPGKYMPGYLDYHSAAEG